jgi:hypothetical protein
MEPILIYIVKSSGLMAGFYLLYHFLLRRETFFTLSRWYLMGGLIASLALPLLEIKRTVILPQAKLTVEDLLAMSQVEDMQQIGQATEPAIRQINWFEMGLYAYILIGIIMLAIVVLNLISLWRLLYRQKVEKQDKFAMVDLDRNVAPFSFFRYIVFNSRLYSSSELESILNHEKVHSEQHHTFDVLLVRLICIVFWFNPFVWLYRKAIAQNLEYIADQEAIKRCNDKKAYQIALLKVGASPNTISITNPFFQSLIKKRIVMLNKEQSKKSNLFKYALALPLIIAFMLAFQVRVIAQAPEAPAAPTAGSKPEIPAPPAPPPAPPVPSPGKTPSAHIIAVKQGPQVIIDKNTTDAQLKSKISQFKKEGITLKVSKIKRNKQGEITGIKLESRDQNGAKVVTEVKGNEPIKPLSVHTRDGRVYSANRMLIILNYQ